MPDDGQQRIGCWPCHQPPAKKLVAVGSELRARRVGVHRPGWQRCTRAIPGVEAISSCLSESVRVSHGLRYDLLQKRVTRRLGARPFWHIASGAPGVQIKVAWLNSQPHPCLLPEWEGATARCNWSAACFAPFPAGEGWGLISFTWVWIASHDGQCSAPESQAVQGAGLFANKKPNPPGASQVGWVSYTQQWCAGGTRTPTLLPASGPKPGASTNFATRAN